MAPLIVRCPRTAALLPTGLETRFETLHRHWNDTVRVHCPHCRTVHAVKVREAFIDSELTLLMPAERGQRPG
jgi:hypothetical protein